MENKEERELEVFSKGQLLRWEVKGEKGYCLGRYLQTDATLDIVSFCEVMFVGEHWVSLHPESSGFANLIQNLRLATKEEGEYYSEKKTLAEKFQQGTSETYLVELRNGERFYGYFRGYSLHKNTLVFTEVFFLDNRKQYVSKIYECNVSDVEKVRGLSEFTSDSYSHAMCAYYNAIARPPLNVLDLCLMRNSDNDLWKLCQFAFNRTERIDYPLFVAVGGLEYYQCIPYEGNEKLLGTTKLPDDGK